jgi:arylsulfatase A-like enzyme
MVKLANTCPGVNCTRQAPLTHQSHSVELKTGITYTDSVNKLLHSRASEIRRGSRARARQPVPAALIMLSALVVLGGAPARAEEHQRPNIILIVVDAMRPDHLGCYGYTRPTSPNIDGLAAQGVVFETAISHAPWTKVSFPTFLTSLYPFEHGISNWESVLPDSVLTLAEFLKGQGYSTACAVQYPVLAPKFNILQGFDNVDLLVLWREGASKVSTAALKAMEESPEPFFLMAHFFDAHKPYNMPDEYIDMVRAGSDTEPYQWTKDDFIGIYDKPSEAEIAGNLLLYDAGIRYADEGIGEILHYLEKRGIADNTMIIVTADHGESFWEHGLPLHSTNVYDEALRVPFIFHYPDKWQHMKRVGGQVRLIDLFPTLADLVAGSVPAQCEGSSLLGLIEGKGRVRPAGSFLPVDIALTECTTNPAPATRSLRTDDWKLICESLTYTFELYNLKDDPRETVNIHGMGYAMEDSLMALLGRVPGVRFRGWRLAFTGKAEGSAYRAKIALLDKGRLDNVRVMTKPAGVVVTLDDDGRSCTIETDGPGTHVVLVDTEPQNASIKISAEDIGKTGSPVFYTGQTEEHRIGESVTLSPLNALGPPSNFEVCRRQGLPGVHIWWLPGAKLAEPGPKAALTEEERQRLRALGYIQ